MWQLLRRRWLLTLLLLAVALVVVLVRLSLSLPPPLAGRLVLSMTEEKQAHGGLYTVDLTSGQVRPVTFPEPVPELAANYNPVLSPDQAHLAFHTFYNGESRIHVAAGVDDGAIIASTSGPHDFQPHWSPDGQQLVFGRSVSFISALFMLDLTTGEERQLTAFSNDIEPDWSPDGQWIVFTTSRDGFQELYRMTPDGAQVERLTVNENINDLYASYSPDGRQIAYMTNDSVGDGTGEIWVMNADGSQPQRLTDNQQDDLAPVWSPDSREIVYSRGLADRSGSDLWLVEPATRTTRQLTTLPGYEYAPVWSPDGQWLVFSSTLEGGVHELYAIRADGSELTPLLPDVDIRSIQATGWMAEG